MGYLSRKGLSRTFDVLVLDCSNLKGVGVQLVFVGEVGACPAEEVDEEGEDDDCMTVNHQIVS